MVNTNFREHILSSGKLIFAGKSAEQNDLLVSQAKRNHLLLHTLAPGSPFVNLGEKPTKEEIKEGALLCAIKSQDWRNNRKNVLVHAFLKADCLKEKFSKNGSWSVKKILDTIKIKKTDLLRLEKELGI